MDDFEHPTVRKMRGLPRADYDDNKIPPSKRGKLVCVECGGGGGRYTKHPSKPNTNVYNVCKKCNGDGEVPMLDTSERKP